MIKPSLTAPAPPRASAPKQFLSNMAVEAFFDVLRRVTGFDPGYEARASVAARGIV